MYLHVFGGKLAMKHEAMRNHMPSLHWKSVANQRTGVHLGSAYWQQLLRKNNRATAILAVFPGHGSSCQHLATRINSSTFQNRDLVGKTAFRSVKLRIVPRRDLGERSSASAKIRPGPQWKFNSVGDAWPCALALLSPSCRCSFWIKPRSNQSSRRPPALPLHTSPHPWGCLQQASLHPGEICDCGICLMSCSTEQKQESRAVTVAKSKFTIS